MPPQGNEGDDEPDSGEYREHDVCRRHLSALCFLKLCEVKPSEEPDGRFQTEWGL